ncbi:MAG TPA: PLP-dependent cysteine synthase family protein [Nitrososphaeraceae archaeon]|nr:PLP-dependent cysteine synthase family protein [Nitrososphaeraceae archaeon]
MATLTEAKAAERIGNTPLVALSTFSTKDIKFYAKLEWYNPFGSVKDRPAYWMIKDGERKGLLRKNTSIIIEPSSGNTGIALAGIATALGYKVEIVIPEKVSKETKSLLRQLGAIVHETTDDLCPRVGTGTDQSIALAKAISKPRPDLYYMPNQYENDANFLAHYEATGPEIWEQTDGSVTHFVTGCGTGGTITGTATLLKERNPDIRVVAVQAQRNHLLQGLRNFEESAMPDLFLRRKHIVDEWFTATNDESFLMVKELAEREKLFVGPSTGAVMSAMLRISQGMKRGGTIVGIFADDGRKFRTLYQHLRLFDEKQIAKMMAESKHLPSLAFDTN